MGDGVVCSRCECEMTDEAAVLFGCCDGCRTMEDVAGFIESTCLGERPEYAAMVARWRATARSDAELVFGG